MASKLILIFAIAFSFVALESSAECPNINFRLKHSEILTPGLEPAQVARAITDRRWDFILIYILIFNV